MKENRIAGKTLPRVVDDVFFPRFISRRSVAERMVEELTGKSAALDSITVVEYRVRKGRMEKSVVIGGRTEGRNVSFSFTRLGLSAGRDGMSMVAGSVIAMMRKRREEGDDVHAVFFLDIPEEYQPVTVNDASEGDRIGISCVRKNGNGDISHDLFASGSIHMRSVWMKERYRETVEEILEDNGVVSELNTRDERIGYGADMLDTGSSVSRIRDELGLDDKGLLSVLFSSYLRMGGSPEGFMEMIAMENGK